MCMIQGFKENQSLADKLVTGFRTLETKVWIMTSSLRHLNKHKKAKMMYFFIEKNLCHSYFQFSTMTLIADLQKALLSGGYYMPKKEQY